MLWPMFTILALVYGVSLLVFLWSLATAPEGVEDEQGFHETKPGMRLFDSGDTTSVQSPSHALIAQ